MRKIWILSVILIAGCQGQQAPVEQTPPPPIVEEVEVIVEPVIPVPPKPRLIIENIMNLTPDTVQKILGEPSLIRTEKGVRVWLYKNSECVLHLYYYPSDNGDFRLDYVETMAADMTADNPTVSPNACLSSHVIPTEGPQPSFPDMGTDLQLDRLGN